MKKTSTVSIKVSASVEKVWECWNEPEHIVNWYFADESWHAPKASVNLKENGLFSIRMEAKSGTEGFDFDGEYQSIDPFKAISFKLKDDRMVWVTFIANEDHSTSIKETFELEDETPNELQTQGWQMILENFKAYVESI